jgi:hypothetical protein
MTPSEAAAIAEMATIVRSHLGPVPCLNHRPVPTRRLHFKMIEDSDSRMWKGHLVRAQAPGHHGQLVTGHTDGLGCPACDWFEPNGASHA